MRRALWVGLLAAVFAPACAESQEPADERDEAARKETRATLRELETRVALLRRPDALGEHPPTDPGRIRLGRRPLGRRLGTPNDLNLGAESLFLCVALNPVPGGDLPATGNLDEDRAAEDVTGRGDPGLREFVDGWGNPIAYIHCRDYMRFWRYAMRDGTVQEVRALRDPGSGAFLRPESFQLLSAGPDGRFGTEDDLRL